MRLSLRTKLALVSLALLALPWVGYRYVQEMERFLLEGERHALLDTAKAVATALHERPGLMRLSTPLRAPAPLLPPAEDETPAAPVETAVPMPVEIGRASARSAGNTDTEVLKLLKGVERSDARIWVVNRELRVLAVAGSLRPAPAETADDSLWRRILGRLIQPPANDVDDPLDEDVLASGPEITAALLGGASTRTRSSRDGHAVVISAAQPIWAADNVVGAVVAEATTNPILSVRNEALERLLLTTLVVFAAVTALVLGFATRLSNRIRRLRDEAEGAIDARGRISQLVSGSSSGDEIGDLSRSFSTMLARLSQHHGYLESLASRLSHELRTPIAVVRSSLENLRLQGVGAEGEVYLDRAEEGLARLSRILARMSEATRLEASLATLERETYDLAVLVRGCVEGYRLAYPARRFDLTLPDVAVPVSGAPDLAAQMLDKLVANALDFSRPGAPVEVVLHVADKEALLSVADFGVTLPEGIAEKLFDSMVSLRPAGSGGEPHLGLGLYVAKLVTDFHGGAIRAENLPTGDGVVIVASFPRQ
jgi:dedicated sortase system histidine kinase